VPLESSHPSRRRRAALRVLATASLFGVALVLVRFAWAGTVDYANLIWNLVLAWVPLLLALHAYDRHRRGARGPMLAVTLGLWLIFLPNAPYLVTDFRLLRKYTDLPFWFDVTMLTTFAWTALVLGFVSVYLVQAIAVREAGARAGRALVVAVFAASSFGIYLGRELRWNSWDLLVQPPAVAADVVRHLGSPELIGTTVLMTAFLTLAYAMLYATLDLALDARGDVA
jgi:uncharacterized membrane protein